MNYIDITLLVLLILAAIGGLKNGFIAEVVSLAALILGIWGAIEFSYITSDVLTEKFNFTSSHLGIISFVITFIVIVILVHVVGNVVNKLAETLMMGFINKLAGMVFAVLKAALILSILLGVVEYVDEDWKIIPEKIKAESRMYEPIRSFAPSLLPFIDFWNNDDKNGNGEKVA